MLFHQRQNHTALPAEIIAQLLFRQHAVRLKTGYPPLLDPVLHRLLILTGNRPGVLKQSRWLIQEKNASLGEVVDEGIRQSPVKCSRLLRPLTGSAAFLAKRIIVPSDFLNGRINRDLLQVAVDGSLCLRVKAADRIHLVVPQLNPPRILFRQRKDINDISTDSELPGRLRLADSLVSHLRKPAAQFLNVNLTVAPNRHGSFSEHVKRQKIVHASPCRGNHHDILLLNQRFYHLHPLFCQQVSRYIRLVENQVSSRKIHDIRIEESEILVQRPCLQLILRNQQSSRPSLGEPRGNMRLLRIQTTGNLNCFAVGSDLLLQILETGHHLQRLFQCLNHTVLLFLFSPFVRSVTRRRYCTFCHPAAILQALRSCESQ